MSARSNTAELPIATVSESNQREHWAVKARRARSHRAIAAVVARTKLEKPQPPCVVKLTRIGARRLDPNNLPGALKHVVDGIADWLGIDDSRDDLVRYEYAQEPLKKRAPCVRVEVTYAVPQGDETKGLN